MPSAIHWLFTLHLLLIVFDMFELQDNSEVYCWLKHQLEPHYSVVSDPQPGYFSESNYCYRVFRGQQLVWERAGDFRKLRPAELTQAAAELVASLRPPQPVSRPVRLEPDFPVASRLPPTRTGTDTTWFSSGRAAFAWALEGHATVRRLFLPTYVCWSLIDVLVSRFPEVELLFYPVNRDLQPSYPTGVEPADAVLFIHYFGHESDTPDVPGGCLLLEDCSHVPHGFSAESSGLAFGSLRKVYRTADGGFLRGSFNPPYEPDRKLDAWLRCEAADWKDLREAENMTDRHWKISDISSQSLSTVISSNDNQIAARRRKNNAFLVDNLTVGKPAAPYAAGECPLLHNRLLPAQADRDSLRSFLASHDIYCSVHWPAHPLLLQRQDQVDTTEAVWIQEHVLSIPVSQEYAAEDMDRICCVCDQWTRAGSARFPPSAA